MSKLMHTNKNHTSTIMPVYIDWHFLWHKSY